MMKLITEELLDTVTSRAKENSRLRMNYNFHASMDAPIHRLLNALEPGTYLPPHRRHYKIFCVNVKYGIQYGFRIFYLIALQNEENYEREESCSA